MMEMEHPSQRSSNRSSSFPSPKSDLAFVTSPNSSIVGMANFKSEVVDTLHLLCTIRNLTVQFITHQSKLVKSEGGKQCIFVDRRVNITYLKLFPRRRQ